MRLNGTDYVSWAAIASGATFSLIAVAALAADAWTSDSALHEHADEFVFEARVEGEHSEGTNVWIEASEEGEHVVHAEEEARVRIEMSEEKGLREVGGAEPLVYIDGVRIAEGKEILESLDPDDIERIEVLKGDAAEAMYGDEASAGVVQIFMKDGATRPGG